MKVTPESSNQWAEEAYIALEVAWLQLKEHYPDLLENEKIEIIGYAPELAAMHRGIDDKTKISETLETVCQILAEDLKLKDDGEPIYYSINFLLAYLESNNIYGYISEKESELIMERLCEDYDISDKA